MVNPEKLPTLGTQDEDKQDTHTKKNHNTINVGYHYIRKQTQIT